jgi:transposase InsO family protein
MPHGTPYEGQFDSGRLKAKQSKAPIPVPEQVRPVIEAWRRLTAPEFVAAELRKWLAPTGTGTLYIEPGSPWENGYCESLNSRPRDEFLVMAAEERRRKELIREAL